MASDQQQPSHVACSSDDETLLGTVSSNNTMRHRARQVAIVLGIGMVVLVIGVSISHGSTASFSPDSKDVAAKFAQIDVDRKQPQWQITETERDMCSLVKSNCYETQCCKTSGYRCFKAAGENNAKCMRHCVPGKDGTCEVMDRLERMQAEASAGVVQPATTMFCFSVYTFNTGSTKKSHEKELLTMQHEKNVSIFQCNSFAVYSDVATSLGNGLSTIKVDDVKGDFHFAKRKTTGAWINTGMFKQVWKAVANAGTYKQYDWTVKVDPDAVFLPNRLVSRIRMMPRPANGIFLVNCKHVDNGFFGNLEVFSSMAFSILVQNIDTCDSSLPWKVGVKNGKYGPMGEDLFAEKCMEKNGVAKAEAFDISIDGACPADRPGNFRKYKKWHGNCKDVVSAAAIHPFKSVKDYSECHDATVETASTLW